MVWKISNKEKVDPKDYQKTAIVGLIIIFGLSILTWAIEHIRII